MTAKIKKIGLIQNAPLPGDFSANLRAIVQGYRDCLDHGAELVIAPAAALCGIDPRSLVNRRSFLRQLNAAMCTLSRELGSAPLLLGGYGKVIDDSELAEDEWLLEGAENDYFDDSLDPEPDVVPVPFLLEHDSVTELEDAEVTTVDDTDIYVLIGDEEVLPESSDFDILVHLSAEPWYAGAADKVHDRCSWEAQTNVCTVVHCAAVGMYGNRIYGGGSALYNSEGKPLMRLPFFETAAKVGNTAGKTLAPALPEAAEMLRMAVERGIRDTVRNNGYGGACIPADHPNSTLLTALAVSALGSGNVCCVTFEGNKAAAETLHADCICHESDSVQQAAAALLHLESPTPALTQRLRASMTMTEAEARGLMLLSPLDRRDIMTGQFTLYGDTCGYLAPLSNLYEMDIYMLCKHFSEQQPDLFGSLTEPTHPERDRIIHELADRNVGASDLLKHNSLLFKENDVRLIQRQIIASELKRAQMPIVLHVDAPAEQLRFPISHRLND